MKTEEMICELRRLEEVHKDDFVGTCENKLVAYVSRCCETTGRTLSDAGAETCYRSGF